LITDIIASVFMVSPDPDDDFDPLKSTGLSSTRALIFSSRGIEDGWPFHKILLSLPTNTQHGIPLNSNA